MYLDRYLSRRCPASFVRMMISLITAPLLLISVGAAAVWHQCGRLSSKRHTRRLPAFFLLSLSALWTTAGAFAIVSFFSGSVSSPLTWKNSVSTGPGHTAVTMMPRERSSEESALERLKTYAFVAAYTANPFCGQNAAAEARLMIRLPYSSVAVKAGSCVSMPCS